MAEDDKTGLTEIPACIILNKIQRDEPVEYDHARIRRPRPRQIRPAYGTC